MTAPVTAAVATSAVRLSSSTVTQYLATKSDSLAPGKRRVVLLRAEPSWDGSEEVAFGVRRSARVVAAPSTLAVFELTLGHLAADATGPEILVVLTDREEADLGPDLLANVHRNRVNSVNTWDIVRSAFGATATDNRLAQENWAAEALLDAAPPGGWPQVAGGVLSRTTALSALAMRRLGIGRYAPDDARSAPAVDGLDANTLLRWSQAPGAADRYLALRSAERAGLSRFLAEADQIGSAGRVLLCLVEAEHGPDAVAFGLVCAALWRHAGSSASSADYQARGRAERWLGDEPPAHGPALDELLAAFGRACEEFVTAQLTVGRSAAVDDIEAAAAARRLTGYALDRAAALTRQFGAGNAAQGSPLLHAGIEARFEAVGVALTGGVPEQVATSVRDLGRHLLAPEPDMQARIERARMAQRLTRWLATDPDVDCPKIAAGLDRHIAETGWVDYALEHIEAGGDSEPGLRAAYTRLADAVRARRRLIDHGFARTLATWTHDARSADSMLTVESFLSSVVTPIAKSGERRVLLLVLDGMSAAIAAELGEELREHWAEYDPVPETKKPPRRRGMAAALPTVTAVSRTSLFAGRLMSGGQADEKRLFPAHAFWGGAPAAVFHKDDLRGAAGEPFGRALTEALADDRTHVAVVLNTIDDRLAKEQRSGEGGWRIGSIPKLAQLLQAAAGSGRAVLITSDHGHVVDRHGERIAGHSGAADRYRPAGQGPLAAAEIGLTGPRVVAPESGNALVALWDADSRYTGKKAGYHGGASPAEVVIPILALLPFAAEPPKGWRELGDEQPGWWHLGRTGEAATADLPGSGGAPLSPPQKASRASGRSGKQQAEIARTHDSLFEVQAVAAKDGALLQPAVVSPTESLVRSLLASSIFAGQVQLLARKPNPAQVEKALYALLEAGGTLPMRALAQRVGWPSTRSVESLAAVLRQLLNHDGEQVLEALPDGRTLRLDVGRLKTQFELP